MVGTTVSHYTILEKLGQGGMGVVYKAQDTTLDRAVALKFLPPHLKENEAEQARFLQEARAVSALNHPNVCGIHAIGEHEGQRFIDMEYVDGVTLRKKLVAGPLAMEAALPYAIQIGEALEEAHAKGIVHRDIKCENIMINAKNLIKVMDFGLAKLKGSLKLTKSSSTVGTLAYMAPEQIQGGEVDGRSDIFSFGVVLYEMLTAHLPFRGEHEAAIMYSIVNEEPEPLAKYLPGASSELLHIIGRALEKNPEERYQSVHDMVIDLRRLKKESTRVSRAIPVQSQHGLREQPSGAGMQEEPRAIATSKRKLLIAAAAVVLVAGGAYVYFTRGPQASSASASAVLNPKMMLRVLQIPLSQISYPGISSDGNWLSFPGGDRNGRWDIYYMHSSSTEPKRITNDSMSFTQQISDISPDGSQIAYTQSGRAWIASSLGGAARKLVESAGLVRWRPDAQRLGYVRVGQARAFYELWSIKPDGSDAKCEFADSAGTAGRYSFAWSPDGRSIAWIRSFEEKYQEVIARELETGKELQLTFDKKNIDDVCWLRNGMVLYSSNKGGNTNLWVVPVTGGASQQVTNGGGPDIGITASADAKKVVYLQQQPVGYIWIAGTRSPSAQQITFDDRDVRRVCLSPDNKRIAFVMADPDPLKTTEQIYVQDRDGENRIQLTNSDIAKSNLVWSPDGKWLAHYSFRRGMSIDSVQVWIVDAVHPGSARSVGYGIPVMWIPNDSLLVVRVRNEVPHSEMLSLKSGVQYAVSEDSTVVFPVSGGKMVVYEDHRKGKEGNWVVPSDYRQNPAHITPVLIARDEDVLGVLQSASYNGEYFFYKDKQKVWWRYQYRTSARERLSLSLPGTTEDSRAVVSDDETEIIYIARRFAGKLVMIENLFQ